MDTDGSSKCFHNETDLGATSAFGKMILTGWYDGPTAGFLQCEGCLGVYVFQLVDWDSKQEVRVLAVGQLPETTFDFIVTKLRRFFGEPRWPFWWLDWPRDSEAGQAADKSIANLMAGASPQLVVAWRRRDEVVLRVRQLGSDDIPDVLGWPGDWEAGIEPASRDWFQFLGLPRESGGATPD